MPAALQTPGSGFSTDGPNGTGVITPWAPWLSKPRSLGWKCDKGGRLPSQATGLKRTKPHTRRPNQALCLQAALKGRKKNNSTFSPLQVTLWAEPRTGIFTRPRLIAEKQIWLPVRAYLWARTWGHPGSGVWPPGAKRLCVQSASPFSRADPPFPRGPGGRPSDVSVFAFKFTPFARN